MKNKQFFITFILFSLFLGASYFAKKSQHSEERPAKKLITKAPSLQVPLHLRDPASATENEKEAALTTSPITSSQRDISGFFKHKKPRHQKALRQIAQAIEPKQKLMIDHSNLELLLDYVACINNCPEGDVISSINNLKIVDPKEESATHTSLGYAYRDKANPRLVGFWNKQLFISTNGTNPKIKNELEKLDFEEIDSPLTNSYVVKYDQDVNSLDKTIDQIKKIDSVMSVSLDLITQPVRFKNAN